MDLQRFKEAASKMKERSADIEVSMKGFVRYVSGDNFLLNYEVTICLEKSRPNIVKKLTHSLQTVLCICFTIKKNPVKTHVTLTAIKYCCFIIGYQ